MNESSDESATAQTAPDDSEERHENVETLRRQVEEKYDFDDFGPAEMAEMSPDEWEAAFDADTWITGEELLDRVETDLKERVARRDVFARIERFDDRLIAYSDTGYATVHGDGSVEGQGTVLRDVKPTVALCSMESYDVPDEPPEGKLPDPTEVPQGSGDFGNRMLQVVAAAQVLAGLGLFAASLFVFAGIIETAGPTGSLNAFVMIAAGGVFVFIGVLLFTVVANARLSDKFRAEEYRNRLRAVDLDEGERPEFLPEDVTLEELVAGEETDDPDAG
jgi:hypothetical protein